MLRLAWELARRAGSVYRSVPVVIGAALNIGAVIAFATTGHRSWLAFALAGALCIIVAFFVANHQREKEYERAMRERGPSRVVHEHHQAPEIPFVSEIAAREYARQEARRAAERPPDPS